MLAPIPQQEPQQQTAVQPPATPPPQAQPPKQPEKPAKPEYVDAQIKTWETMSKRPLAKKYGMDAIFQQKIADRRTRLQGWADMVNQGLPIEKINADDRAALVQYMKSQGLHPETQRLRPEYVSGLNVLHVSLFGTNPYRSGKADTTQAIANQGLVDYLDLLDSESSKFKLALLPELYHAEEHPPGTFGNAFTLWKVKAMGLTDREKQFIIQLNRARGAINSLRTVTGLPRATQQLMLNYQLELPNVVFDDTKSAQIKLLTIQREIEAALKKASPSAEQMPVTTEEPPPPPEGFEIDK